MLGAVGNGELRVEFFRHSDRVAHRILCRGVVIAESVEGTPEEDWPPSPPFQDVHLECGKTKAMHEPGKIGFLVGMAGRSHWSATVEPSIDRSIAWEIACRLHGSPQWLGVRYRLTVPVAVEKEDTIFRSESIPVPVFTRHFQFSLDRSSTVSIDVTTDGEFQLEGNQLSVRFPVIGSEYPQTGLWGYCFAVAKTVAR